MKCEIRTFQFVRDELARVVAFQAITSEQRCRHLARFFVDPMCINGDKTAQITRPNVTGDAHVIRRFEFFLDGFDEFFVLNLEW